jgi:hypothetical protein
MNDNFDQRRPRTRMDCAFGHLTVASRRIDSAVDNLVALDAFAWQAAQPRPMHVAKATPSARQPSVTVRRRRAVEVA